MIYKAPYLQYDNIRPYAAEFLAKYNPDQSIPVPIEEIIEFKLKMDIFPFPRLKIDFNVDGFLANNMSAIYVDDYTMQNYENRYRFTLAHEIGHSILHKDFYEQTSINSMEDWVDLVNTLDSDQYSWFEKHAYDFAGLVLVPCEQLVEEYRKALRILEDEKFEFKRASVDMINSYVSGMISRTFKVSEYVVNKRLNFDNLTPYSAL